VITPAVKKVEIRIKGEIDKGWMDWFGNLAISHSSQGDSILTGFVQDQAELRGILTRLADLNLELISVNTKLEDKA
jgi:hypothetical protein